MNQLLLIGGAGCLPLGFLRKNPGSTLVEIKKPSLNSEMAVNFVEVRGF